MTRTTVEVSDIENDAGLIGNDALAQVAQGGTSKKWAATR